MADQWQYGKLYVVPTYKDNAGTEPPCLYIAILADSTHIGIIATWDSDQPQHLFRAMDNLGKERWMIGPASWIWADRGNFARIGWTRSAFPQWIASATENISERGEWVGGWGEYPLRRMI
jgi:hypothetical protein